MKLYLKICVLAVLSFIFLFLSARKLSLPGYYYDEALYSLPALDMVQQKGNPSSMLTVKIAGKIFPVMLGSYVGSTQSYAVAGAYKLFGSDYRVSRAVPIFFALCAVWLTWWLCEILFGWQVAFISCLLMVFNVSFIFWSRVGLVSEAPLLVSLELLAAILYLKWHKTSNLYYLYGTVFVTGLGIYTKLNYLVVAASFVICTLLLASPDKRLKRKAKINCIVAFAAGMLPLIYFNCVHQVPTIKVLLNALTGANSRGISNYAFIHNFLIRCKHLTSLLAWSSYDLSGSVFRNPGIIFIYAVSYLYLVYAAFFSSVTAAVHVKLLRFIVVVQTLLFIGSCFTVSNFIVTHLFVMLPFIFITIALFMDYLISRNSRIAKFAAVMVIAGYIISNLVNVRAEYRSLDRTGGKGLWSDAIYQLGSYLGTDPSYKSMVLDWGIAKNLKVITKNEIDIEEASDNFDLVANDKFIDRLKKFSGSKKVYFIMLSRPYSKSGVRLGYYDAFEKFCKTSRFHTRLVKEISDREGDPVFQIFCFS